MKLMLKFSSAKIRLLIYQILAIIPFVIFIFYLFDLWYETSKQAVLNENYNHAKMVSLYISDSFRYGLDITQNLAETPDFYNNVLNEKTVAKSVMTNIVNNHPTISTINVIDKNGIPLLSSYAISDEELAKLSVTDRDYFNQVLTTKKSVISDPLISKLRQTLVVIMASPIIINNQVEAVVTGGLEINALKANLEKVKSSRASQNVYILDSNGEIVFKLYKNGVSDKEKGLLKNNKFIKEAMEGKFILIEDNKFPILDESVLGASVPVASADWVVVSTTPVIEVFAPLFRVQAYTWVLILICLLFSFLMITYALRKVRIIY